ncbi:GYF domain-containing protein, putative [Babesia ovata]|uniref:GYF domain-containing protein, putative n=1 Tax=Babesia ovata TaxID=189622 RepID=A0A2H6KHD7_9APIC|nr:GYF domain-containing protein, putative [Babesia ovata]GBE62404.1 GYF domain-containing protein, putative [Babesia ovata]
MSSSSMRGEGAVLPTVKLSELTSRDDIDDELTDTILVLRQSESPSDASPEDIVINVHSGVLRVASPFFMRAFNDLQSTERIRQDLGGVSQGRIRYTLVTPHPLAVQRILYYIYKNDYQNVTEEPQLLVPMYQESARFGLSDLKQSLLRLIRSQHSLQVLASLSYAAESSGEVELSRDCGRVLADAAFAVFSGSLLQRMGMAAVKALLESDNVQLDEVQTFTALCQFLESNVRFVSPYASAPIGPKEKVRCNYRRSSGRQDLLKHVRFCSMAPKAIDQLRHDNLSTLLLDATLRILQGATKKPRHFPWTDNADYTCMTYKGLFPVLVVRASREQLGLFDPNTGNAKLVTPNIAKLPSDSRSGLSFTVGTEREMSVCWWAYEVSKTKRGNIAFGVAFASHDPIDDASRPCFTSMTRSRRVVFYYEFAEDTFKSGYIEPSANRFARHRFAHLSQANQGGVDIRVQARPVATQPEAARHSYRERRRGHQLRHALRRRPRHLAEALLPDPSPHQR